MTKVMGRYRIVRKINRYVCVIPAKAHSRRAEGKNVELLEPTLRAALDALPSWRASDVTVSTDSVENRRLARDLGAHVIWREPEDPMLGDEASATDHVLDCLDQRGVPDGSHVVQLLMTAPLRTHVHIQEAMKVYAGRDPGHSALISVTPVHGKALCFEDSLGLLRLSRPPLGMVDGEWERPLPMYLSNGAIQITQVGLLRQHRSFWNVPKRIPFLMDHRSGFDVDTIAQLEMARMLLEGGQDGSR